MRVILNLPTSLIPNDWSETCEWNVNTARSFMITHRVVSTITIHRFNKKSKGESNSDDDCSHSI